MLIAEKAYTEGGQKCFNDDRSVVCDSFLLAAGNR